MDRSDLTGYLCEQCLDAPAVAFVAAPWGGEMAPIETASEEFTDEFLLLAIESGLVQSWAGAPRLPPALCGHRPPGARAEALAGQRAPDRAPRSVPAVL